MKLRLLWCALLAAGASAQSAPPAGADTLAAELRQHYKVAAARLGAGGQSAFEPGTILTLRKDGIVSFSEKDSSYALLCPTEVRGAIVRTPRGPACTSLAPPHRRLLKSAEKACVMSIDLNKHLDTVSFFISPYDPKEEGGKRCGAARALVVFRLPKGRSKLTAGRIQDLVGETLSEEGAEVQ